MKTILIAALVLTGCAAAPVDYSQQLGKMQTQINNQERTILMIGEEMDKQAVQHNKNIAIYNEQIADHNKSIKALAEGVAILLKENMTKTTGDRW